MRHHTDNLSDNLFTCFREDHRVLGAGFHRLSQYLRAADVESARTEAQRLDDAAGSHIAFEEEEFYPRLVPLFGKEEVDRMCREHRRGLAVIRALVNHKMAGPLDEKGCDRLLKHSEAMEEHIADCAELFEAIGRIPAEEQHELHQRLLAWRQQQPKWTGSEASGHTKSVRSKRADRPDRN